MLREIVTQDIFLGFLLICLLLVVITKQLFSVRFIDFLTVIWNNRYLKLYHKDRKQLDTFNSLLFINFVIAFGVFIYIALPKFNLSIIDTWYTLPIIFASLFIFVILKQIIEKIVSIIFEFDELEKIYQFQKITYKNISGLLFLVSIILLMYSSLSPKIIIFATLSLVFLISFIGFTRFLKVYQKMLLSHIFYFLLYLCALEIGPYIILFKVIRDYFV